MYYGKPFVELNSATYITSSTGYTAKIDYAGKGWLSGKKNHFSAVLHPTGKEKEVLYTLEGQWTDTFTIKSGGGSGLSKLKSEPIETYDAKVKTTPLTTRPIEQQDPYESNRAWNKVSQGIVAGNMDIVHNEKSKIENTQREMRKKEQAEGKEWQRKYFIRNSPPDELFDKLANPIGERIEADKTGGIWRFDENKKNLRDGIAVIPEGMADPEP